MLLLVREPEARLGTAQENSVESRSALELGRDYASDTFFLMLARRGRLSGLCQQPVKSTISLVPYVFDN